MFFYFYGAVTILFLTSMRNKEQCSEGLRYPDFTIIYIQTFTSPKVVIPQVDGVKEVVEGNIDDQLFMSGDVALKRYELPGFRMRVKMAIGEKEQRKVAEVEGEVRVWMTVFFGYTVQLSYRLLVLNSKQFEKLSHCRSSVVLDTDELIVLAGLVQRVEHWEFDEKEKRQKINGCLQEVEIEGVTLNAWSERVAKGMEEGGMTFEEVQRRYRNLVDKTPAGEFRYEDYHYTFIDVWETVEHDGETRFADMEEDEVIEHIERHHRAELVGLMSLYPCEWPYRMDSAYEAVCGPNIAIDTDDLVLANESMSVVFGTYGRRGAGSATDWKKHLMRRDRYHVSWPEYLVLVEILLAKKHTINYVLNKYIYNSSRALTAGSYDMVEQNSLLNIRLSKMLLQLDAIRYLRYVSHKHMSALTEERLRIAKDREMLDSTFAQVGTSLNTVNDVAELKEANATKFILFFISVASLFGVLLEGDGTAPVFAKISEDFGEGTAVFLVVLTCLGIVYGLYKLIQLGVRWYRQRKRRKKGF